MKCNIDNKGRVLRLIFGMALVFVGSILFVAGVPGIGWWRAFQGGVVFLGVFMIVEGSFGWCAVRALLDRN